MAERKTAKHCFVEREDTPHPLSSVLVNLHFLISEDVALEEVLLLLLLILQRGSG